MKLTKEQLNMQNGLDGTITVETIDDVAIIRFKCGENRLNLSFVDKFNKALDQVESNDSIKAVITTGEGRFYSNGFDAAWLQMLVRDDPQTFMEFMTTEVVSLYHRLLYFPMPIIAAVNGHCFAAGAVIALCHDSILMNSKRGWFCMNEVHMGFRLNDMTKVLARLKLPPGPAIHEVLVLGKQFTAQDAEKRGVIHKACESNDLVQDSIALAKSLTKRGGYDKTALSNMKRDMYGGVQKAYEQQLASGNFTSKSNFAPKSKSNL